MFASFVKKHPPKAEEIIASLPFRNKSSLSRAEKRILKRELNRQLKIYAVSKVTHDNKKADSTLPAILTILVAIGLLAGLAAIICSLSCSGADVAAGLIGILSLAAIIAGSIAVIKHYKRKSTEKPKPELLN